MAHKVLCRNEFRDSLTALYSLEERRWQVTPTPKKLRAEAKAAAPEGRTD